jgi:hypothetical protein
MQVVTSSDSLPGSAALTAPKNSAKRRERLFFSGMAIALTVTVFAGFAPTYYLRGTFGGRDLTPSLLLHGFAFSTWMVLLVTQTSLVAANKTALHRRLGFAGAALGVLMMVLGAYVAITRTRDGLTDSGPIDPLAFLAIPLATIVVFPILFGAALWLRRRTDAHKRLILLATLELATAGIARLPVINGLGPVAFFGITDLFVVAIAIYDWRTRGRLHPATLWGGLLLIASQPLRIAIGFTPAWQSFSSWLTS